MVPAPAQAGVGVILAAVPVITAAGVLAAVDVAELVAGFRLRGSAHEARSLSHRAT
jgi:hypothetical protein